jgi:HK97 family phage portal protein
MGLIAQRVAAAVDEIRSAADFLRDDDDDGPMTTAGVSVSARAALGLTTVWRCVDLLSSAVAMAPKDVIVKVGGESFREFTKPSWLSMPNPSDPTYTADDYFAQVALSLLIDGNYFVHAFPYVWDAQRLTVLDPRRVRVVSGPRYEILDATGKVTNTLTPMQMLHGTWLRPAGELRGISPLEAMKRAVGAAIATEDFAARFFGQGASLSFGVEVPYQMDDTKLGNLRKSLRAKYVGLRNSHAIGVLADGGKFVTGLAPTPEQAQMLASQKWHVEDLCRPYGVPPSLVGSQEPGASSYNSSSVHDMQFKERGVLPLAVRIERQHSRLVAVPSTITDPTATAQFKFNLDGIARVDLLTRSQAYKELVFAGIMQPSEGRALEDLPPAPGADRLFMQSQMVPIDQLGQPADGGA